VLKRVAAAAGDGWSVIQVGPNSYTLQRSYDAGAMMVAGAACLPTAAQVAAWLTRRAFTGPLHPWTPSSARCAHAR
jgi:hypothetical protein